MKFNIMKAMSTIQGVVMALTGIVVTLIVGLLVGGATVDIGTSGDITVSDGFNSVLSAQDTQLSGYFSTTSSAIGTAVGLVGLVVLLAVFGYFIFQKGRKGKGNLM